MACFQLQPIFLLCVLCSFAFFSKCAEADSAVADFDRKLESFLNPGFSGNSSDVTLMYIKSTGSKDVIHNVWDFTRGTPAILYAVTELNTTLNVTWDVDVPSLFNFSSSPKYSFGIQINKLWEFNDVNDTAKFNPAEQQSVEFDFADIKWKRSEVIQEDGEVTLTVVTHTIGKGKDKRNGTITIKLDLFPFNAYAFELPHLIHSANSSLVDIVLENISLSENFNRSRFAAELDFVSSEQTKANLTMYVRKGLDDEHTPGVFEIIEIVTPESASANDGGFVQYRPICYNNPQRDVSSSVGVQTGELSDMNLDTRTTTAIFFDDMVKDFNILSESLIVTFGMPQDGFYRKSNYTIWAFTVGYGSPPIEGFSLFVILILSIGLGIPLVILTVGALFICINRLSSRNRPMRLVEE